MCVMASKGLSSMIAFYCCSDAHEYLNQALHLIIWDGASNPCHDVGGNTEKASGIKR